MLATGHINPCIWVLYFLFVHAGHCITGIYCNKKAKLSAKVSVRQQCSCNCLPRCSCTCCLALIKFFTQQIGSLQQWYVQWLWLCHAIQRICQQHDGVTVCYAFVQAKRDAKWRRWSKAIPQRYNSLTSVFLIAKTVPPSHKTWHRKILTNIITVTTFPNNPTNRKNERMKMFKMNSNKWLDDAALTISHQDRLGVLHSQTRRTVHST